MRAYASKQWQRVSPTAGFVLSAATGAMATFAILFFAAGAESAVGRGIPTALDARHYRPFDRTPASSTSNHEQISGPETAALRSAHQPCTTFTPTVSGTQLFRFMVHDGADSANHAVSILDGNRSIDPGNARALALRREQVSGPGTLVLESATLAHATFTPTIAGANVFRLLSFVKVIAPNTYVVGTSNTSQNMLIPAAVLCG